MKTIAALSVSCLISWQCNACEALPEFTSFPQTSNQILFDVSVSKSELARLEREHSANPSAETPNFRS